jgi:CubicO group peptidase (beta-lactamase class C family)
MTATPAPTELAGLAAWLDDEAAAHRFSGVVLVWREGAPLFAHAAGLAHRGHRVPNTVDTRFFVASVTKMVTAATVLGLVDAGALALDAPLVEVLPAEWHTAAMTPAHTVRHLLQHTSGLPNYHDDDDETWASFTACWDRLPPQKARTPRDLLPLFADLPAVFAPGTAFRYGDANYVLAGLVIEAVTGEPYDVVATRSVLGPAGMNDSLFGHVDDEPDRLASHYYVDPERPYERWRTSLYGLTAGAMPDGGMVTTATDLARFVDALLAGRLVSPASVQLMVTPNGLQDDVETYGAGLELTVTDGRVVILGHGGSDPGVSSLVSHVVDAGTTVVVLCNQDRGSWPATQRAMAVFGLPDPRE